MQLIDQPPPVLFTEYVHFDLGGLSPYCLDRRIGGDHCLSASDINSLDQGNEIFFSYQVLNAFRHLISIHST